jgi:hypothetical protein
MILFMKKTKEEELVNKPVCGKWEIITSGMKDWASPHLPDKWQAYGHTILCHKQMGLGP